MDSSRAIPPAFRSAPAPHRHAANAVEYFIASRLTPTRPTLKPSAIDLRSIRRRRPHVLDWPATQRNLERGRAHVFFRFRCPQCKTYFYSSTHVMAPKCELDDAPLNVMKPVQHLPQAAQLIDSLAKNKSPRVLPLKRSSSFLSHWSDSDDSDSSGEEEDDLDEDPNYAEQRTQFHINMRYTAGERRPFPPDPRDIAGAVLNEGKSVKGVRIGDPAGRRSARGVMGMSARACSGRGLPFKRDAK